MSELTILIPTRNRYVFLSRLLRYYASSRLRHLILIGDSSDSDQAEKITETINCVRGSVRVVYQRFTPTDPIYEVAVELLKRVSTPYSVLNADDDFLVCKTMDLVIEFLDHHPDYSIAHGDEATMKLKSTGAFGEVASVARYMPATVEFDTARERVSNYMGSASTAFSVCRTEQMLADFQETISLGLDTRFSEMLTTCLSIVRGKSKKLSGLYLVRQLHSGQLGSNSSRGPDLFEWIAEPAWAGHYARFRDCLAHRIAQHDGLTCDEAKAAVKEAFWSAMTQKLSRSFREAYSSNPATWRERMGHIPGIGGTWSALRSVIPGLEPEISLKAILRPSSPYHKDFLPIYRALTSEQCAS